MAKGFNAEESARIKREAEHLADALCFTINRRSVEYPETKYAAQALLEEVVAILQERI